MTRRSILLPAAMFSVVATMLALGQAFTRQLWFFPSVVAVCLAFGVGWLGRRLDVPGVLAPALSLLALVAFVGFVFHRDTTAFGFFPTSETMRAIGESIQQATRDIRELAAPAEPTDALTLLATSGVFLVAMLVDLVVFRTRRPVAAGLPLLGLYLVPTAVASKANALAFVAAAAGYLVLLVAEGRDRARAWGRRLSGIDNLDDAADVSHVARVGRRIGTAAVGLALAVPLVLPNVGEGILSGNGNGPFGRDNGSRTVSVESPIVEIQRQLLDTETRNLFTVRTDHPDYLRLTSLDEFNGSEWKLGHQQAEDDEKVGKKHTIPAPDELAGIHTFDATYEVNIGPLAVRWLPLPYAPSVVDVKGDWRYEPTSLAVFSAKRLSKDVSYTATSHIPDPTRDQLRLDGEIPDAIRRTYLARPEGDAPQLVLDLLAQVTGGLDNPYDKAQALQEWFRTGGGFEYTLEAPPGTSQDALSDFLLNRKGYCQQFAATMAYMARLADIPSRVAVGFTKGNFQNDGTWVVTNHDAHAWPELYFPHAGWVRFEPTPRSGSGVTPPDYSQQPEVSPTGPVPTETATPTPSAEPSASETAGPRGAKDIDRPDGGSGGALPTARRGAARVAPWVALALVLVLVTPSAVGYFVRRRRRRTAVDHVGRIHAAWCALADAAEDTGYTLRRSDSPRAAAQRLIGAASLTGPVADEVARLAQAEERARYARSAPPVDGLDASVRSVRRALVAGLPKRARLRAVVLPPSSVRRILEAGTAASRWLDRSRTATRARLASVVRRRRPRAV